MAKFADFNALDRWKGHILDAIDDKSNSTHRHTLVNGKRIVISDTVPTVNDENVITLIVDTAHVPVANMELQEAFSIVDKTQVISIGLGLKQIAAWHEYTFQTLLDGEAVSAEYQFEKAGYSSRTIMQEYSSDNTISLLVDAGYIFYVKVRVNSIEKEFSIEVPEFDESIFSPQVPATGVYVDNQLEIDENNLTIQHGQLVNAEFRYYVEPGTPIESIISSELFVVDYMETVGYKDWEPEGLLSAVTNPEYKVCNLQRLGTDCLRGSLTPVYNMTSENEYVFLTNKMLTTSGENIYGSLFCYIGYDLVYDHFANHWKERLYGYLITSKPENNGKIHVPCAYNSGTSYYYDNFGIKLTFDAAFGYDITISLVDSSGTPLSQSTRFPLKPNSNSEFTLSSGSKSVTESLYHRVTTTGTYYIIANISGGGFEQSVALEVEVVDTDL